MFDFDFQVTPAANSRVFLIERRAGPSHAPQYKSCMAAGEIAIGYGDAERIECPDPAQYEKWIEVGSIKGSTERPTTSLEGRYPLKNVSDLLRMAESGCAFDAQVHFGACTDPTRFNTFIKALIFEDASITSYGTSGLGALSSSDNAVVGESADISGARVYEVVPVVYTERAQSLVTTYIYDITICSANPCEEDATDCDACHKIFAIQIGNGPTPNRIVYSLDKGATWVIFNTTISGVYTGSAIACVDDYVVVGCSNTTGVWIAPLSEMDGVTTPTWSYISTGFLSGIGTLDMWSVGAYAFVVGNSGTIYGMRDPGSGVTVLDGGSATAQHLYGVHALSQESAVAVGASDAVVYTRDGASWTPATGSPGSGTSLFTVWMKSDTEWWVGGFAGRMYYTLDSGQTWTEKGFAGSGSGSVHDIVFSTPSVGWMTHTPTVGDSRIFRTYDGGYSWVLTPESQAASLPAGASLFAIATCTDDPNFIAGVGEHYVVVSS